MSAITLSDFGEDDNTQALDALAESQPTANKRRKSIGRALVAFSLVAFKDIRLDPTQRNYLIKYLLPRRGLAVIWGAWKCYKSFIAMDMALHISLDWEYRGHRVQQAPVVYIALEGRDGVPARKEAFCKYHGVEDAPFHLLTTPLDLVKQRKELIAAIEAQLAGALPGAIFIDTLNRSLVGSESKDEDMAAYLHAAGDIEQQFKCVVAIVHHCGLDRDRMRGHSSLPAAVDVQLRIERTDDYQATLTVMDAKDFPEGAEVFYRLQRVEVGTDPDGDPITSLVVLSPEESGPAPERRKPTKGLGAEQKNALTALTECLAEFGTAPSNSLTLPASVTKVVTLEQWKEQLFRRGVLERGEGKNWASKWSRLRNKLFERRHIGITNDWVWHL